MGVASSSRQVTGPRAPMLLESDDARAAILRGSRLMTRLLAGTLGPHGATVVAAPLGGQGRPQVLSRAGIIARRVVEVADPFENMGVMLVRHAAYTVEQAMGDGVATAAVILDSLLSGGARLIAAGYPLQQLASEIDTGLTDLRASLAAARLGLTDAEAAGPVIAQAIPETDLAESILDAVLAVGESGDIEVRDGYGVRSTVEFVEGLRCRGTVIAGGRVDMVASVQELGPAVVLVSAEPITDAAQVAGLIELVLGCGIPGLLLVVPQVADPVRQVIASANTRSGLTRTLAVAPEASATTEDVLADLAAYCGTPVRAGGAPQRLDELDPDQLGLLRRVWATADEFAVVGPRDRAGALNQARQLRRMADACRDAEAAMALRRRAAALMGRTAILTVGGQTEVEREERRGRVEGSIRAAQFAAGRGVVAGGGAALARADVGPLTTGALLLREAIAQPLRRIAHRAGLDPATLLDQTREGRPGSRFDVVARRWIVGDAPELVDSLAVTERAVSTAVSTALTSLSSAVLVRSAHPEWRLTP